MKCMVYFFPVIFFRLQQLMSQQTGFVPGRLENLEPFIYNHTTEELKKLTKKHVLMVGKVVEEMEEIIFNGPYKASFGSLTIHPAPEW